jgi:hypothetical protein
MYIENGDLFVIVETNTFLKSDQWESIWLTYLFLDFIIPYPLSTHLKTIQCAPQLL